MATWQQSRSFKNISRKLLGCILSGFSINTAVDDLVNVTADVTFGSEGDATTSLDSTPAADDINFPYTFAHGSSYQMLVTDGKTKFETTMAVSYDSVGTYRTRLSFTDFETVSGAASLGEIFDINIFNKPTIDVKRASIGTSFNVVQETEEVVNEILESNDIVFTKSTDNNRYYEAYDLQGLDLFTACNFVLSFKDRKLLVDGSDISVVKGVEDINYTNINISDRDNNTNVAKIERNKSLFDYYNEVTVYGDGVKSTSRDNATIRKTNQILSLEEVDLSILTEHSASERAKSLLKLHSDDAHAISFRSDFTNMEFLKPGQIITMDYTTEHIPKY